MTAVTAKPGTGPVAAAEQPLAEKKVAVDDEVGDHGADTARLDALRAQQANVRRSDGIDSAPCEPFDGSCRGPSGGVRDCAGETDHSQSGGEAGPGAVQHYLVKETLPHG